MSIILRESQEDVTELKLIGGEDLQIKNLTIPAAHDNIVKGLEWDRGIVVDTDS